MPLLFALLTAAQALCLCAGFWERQLEPKLFIEEYPHQAVRLFSRGNGSEVVGESLKILLLEGDHVLVGGRDALHNLSLHTLEQVHNISWPSSNGSDLVCRERQDVADMNCANYIRVAKRIKRNGLLVCGTNSYSPRCREYQYEGELNRYTWKTDVDGRTLCPYDRNHSAVILTAGNRQIAGISGYDTYKKLPALTNQPLRTKLNDWRHLSPDAQFVGAFGLEEHAYFFLTETAQERRDCGRNVKSTVIRVCVSDPGAAQPFDWMWTSFQKARLRCAMNGTNPFEFTDIQAVNPSLTRWNNAFVLYAVFSRAGTPFQASAVCAFNVEEINNSLKSNKSECNSHVTAMSNESAFLEENDPLSQMPIENYLNEPMLPHVGFDYYYTSLTVDPQVRSSNGRRFDVIFLGTSHGHIIKAINIGFSKVNTVVIEDIIVFPGHEPVLELKIVRRRSLTTLLATTHYELISVPLDNCNWTVRTCSQCVGLQDPYCVWDKATSKCQSLVDGPPPRDSIQEVVGGHSIECPDEFSKHISGMKFPRGDDPWGFDGVVGGKNIAHLYSAHTLGFAIAFCIMGSIVVGFGTGYWYRHHQRKEMSYFNYR